MRDLSFTIARPYWAAPRHSSGAGVAPDLLGFHRWKSQARRQETQSLARTLFGLIIAVPWFLPLPASAQSDPLVGAWKFVESTGSPQTIVLALMTFNAGGTATELDTGGTNPSSQESIALGTWSNTGGRTYTFKEQNLLYDSSGNLAAIAIGTANFTLAPGMNTIVGVATFNFYSCSVTLCPGPLQAGPILIELSGTRL